MYGSDDGKITRKEKRERLEYQSINKNIKLQKTKKENLSLFSSQIYNHLYRKKE